MLGNLLVIFGLMIVLIIYFEYRNEKKYQEERRKKLEDRLDKKTTHNDRPRKRDVSRQTTPRIPKKEQPKELPEEEQPKKKQLPPCDYPKFSHIRLIDMGLSDKESKEFVAELIPQIETQIPLIKEAMGNSNFHQMERLTHNIKGSATNLGTGGISDLLVECNTYLKTGTDSDIAKVYFDNLVHYTEELKTQYA